MTPTQEIARRRTFAIISHPDAGKTTLTEKFLLYGGAVHLAGAVKSRKAEVGQQIDRTRAATRFEAPPVPPPSGATSPTAPPVAGRPADRPRTTPEAGAGLGPDQPQENPGEAESYTNRLLKAKKKVWEERDQDKDKGKRSP